jgi:hypothetical protein
MITILSALVSPLSFRVRRVEDKSCRRWLRRGCYNGLPALSPPFTSRYFPVSCAAGRYTSKLKLFGCLLNPSHEKQNDKDDQDDADESDATVTIPVPIAAEAATKSTEQEDYENDNEDESERQGGVLSFQRCERSRRRTPRAMWHRRDFHASPSVRTLEFGRLCSTAKRKPASAS